jgi:hypothetical protein
MAAIMAITLARVIGGGGTSLLLFSIARGWALATRHSSGQLLKIAATLGLVASPFALESLFAVAARQLMVHCWWSACFILDPVDRPRAPACSSILYSWPNRSNRSKLFKSLAAALKERPRAYDRDWRPTNQPPTNQPTTTVCMKPALRHHHR